jgi:hypothetical protein
LISMFLHIWIPGCSLCTISTFWRSDSSRFPRCFGPSRDSGDREVGLLNRLISVFLMLLFSAEESLDQVHLADMRIPL